MNRILYTFIGRAVTPSVSWSRGKKGETLTRTMKKKEKKGGIMLLFCGGPRRDGDDHRHKEDKLYGDHHEWRWENARTKGRCPSKCYGLQFKDLPV